VSRCSVFVGRRSGRGFYPSREGHGADSLAAVTKARRSAPWKAERFQRSAPLGRRKKGAPAANSATSAPGEASSRGYFFPIATVTVPVGETQPEDEISVTESETEPLAPAVKVTWLVPCPAVIEPFEMLHE